MEQALSQTAINKAHEAFGHLAKKQNSVPKPVGENILDVAAYLAKYGVEVIKIKPHGGSTLYCLKQCIFDSSHVNNESAIGLTSEGKLFYQCFHDGCKGYTWHDARKVISGNESLFEKRDNLESNLPQNKPVTHPWSYVTHNEIYLKKPEEKPIAENFLYESEATIIHAPGGGLKSLLSQDIGMHLAAQKPDLWGKFSIPKYRATLFIQSENSWSTINQRVRKKCTGDPELKQGFQNVFYPQSYDSIQIAGHVTNETFRNQLYELVKRIETENECKIDIIVFDPLISFHEAEENDNSRMRTTLDLISEIAFQIKATPAVLHHANKQGGLRGASSIWDWARSIIKLSDATYRGQRRIKLENEKCNNHEPFQPFILAMDEYLNFQAVEISDTASNKSKQRGQLVQEALGLCGGRVETKTALIEQYRELSGIKSNNTIHNHITEAVTNEFIKREFYRDDNKGFQKCRLFIE